MVIFRTLKYKHQRQASELVARRANGEAIKDDQDALIMSLIESWDYVDIETGQPILPGQPDELTIDQYNEVIAEFNAQMNGQSKVKKTNALPSSSGRTRSRARSRNYPS